MNRSNVKLGQRYDITRWLKTKKTHTPSRKGQTSDLRPGSIPWYNKQRTNMSISPIRLQDGKHFSSSRCIYILKYKQGIHKSTPSVPIYFHSSFGYRGVKKFDAQKTRREIEMY
jgi:hypothetical protein